MSPWWLLRSSLCQDISLEELVGLRDLFSPTTLQEFMQGEMHLGWVLNMKYTQKKNNKKPHLTDVNVFKSSICKHCTELGQDLLFIVQNP